MLCIDASPNFIVLLFMCLYEIFSNKYCQYFPIIFSNNICHHFFRCFPLIFSIYFPLFYITTTILYILIVSIYYEYFFFFILREFSLFYFLREIPLVHKKAATFSAATFCCFIQWLLFHLALHSVSNYLYHFHHATHTCTIVSSPYIHRLFCKSLSLPWFYLYMMIYTFISSLPSIH